MLWLEEGLLGLLLLRADNNNDRVPCASFASPYVALVAWGIVIVSVAR